jgi:hypothetical protein
MEKENLKVVTSKFFDFIDLPSIHEYGMETFGLKLADYFIAEIYICLNELALATIFIPNAVISPLKQRNTEILFWVPISLYTESLPRE